MRYGRRAGSHRNGGLPTKSVQTKSAILVAVVTALNLVLTFILTPRLGIVGAASAATVAVLVRGILLAFVI